MWTSDSTTPTGHGEAVELQVGGVANHASPLASPKAALTAIQGVNNNVNSADDVVLEDQNGDLIATKSTQHDLAGMRRMGKDQQLIRHFRFISITAFVAIATAAWEIGLFILTPGLVDGGRAGLVWNSLWNFVGFGPVYISMAEMASMAPIAGAQYHWVSEFAPEKWQRFLSYLTGWTSTIAWQAGNAMGIFLVGSLVQTIILINNESYGFPSWQGTLLAIGAMCLAYIGNVYGNKIMPHWQTAVFVVHVVGYIGYIAPVWANAPKATHHQVWGEFENTGGWSNIGLAVLVGQLTGVSEQVGIDTAAHMSEEVADAASSIPKTMITVYLINFVLIFSAILTVCYHIPDLHAALNDPTTYPAIYVLRFSMSTAWITVILVIICFLNVASNIVYLAAVTRDLFAFARDKGLPFSSWLSTVHPSRHIPVNACQFSCLVAVLLSLIYIGSPVAFYAITSLATVSLLQCYCLSIGCLLYRRIYHPSTLPPAKFSLGRWGIPVNASAVAYSLWAFFWSFWPQYSLTGKPAGQALGDFNWASVIFVAVLIGAMAYFVLRAKDRYVGPVTEVEGRKGNQDR